MPSIAELNSPAELNSRRQRSGAPSPSSFAEDMPPFSIYLGDPANNDAPREGPVKVFNRNLLQRCAFFSEALVCTFFFLFFSLFCPFFLFGFSTPPRG